MDNNNNIVNILPTRGATRELTVGETAELDLSQISFDKLDNSVDEGNTNSSSTKQSQIRRWCFTFWPPTIEKDKIDIFDKFSDILESSNPKSIKKYVVQLEKGSLGAGEHYQGYVEFSNGRTLSGIKKIWYNTIHWEPARGDDIQNYNYCTKITERLKGPWVRGFPEPVKPPFITPRVWQQFVIDIYNSPPDKRTIYWFWERLGNTGKTALATHLCLLGESIYCGGKADDVKYQVAEWTSSGKPLRCCIWDIPRCVENHISYNAIESVKNGIFFSGKYESKMIIYNSPHVICFSNQAPEFDKLSEDRWKVYNITHLENNMGDVYDGLDGEH